MVRPATHPVVQAINFVGSPVIVLAISVAAVHTPLVPRMDKHTTAERLEEWLAAPDYSLVTALAALGAILRDKVRDNSRGAGCQPADLRRS